MLATTFKGLLLATLLATIQLATASTSPIANFNQAKIFLNDHVYHDRRTTTYCGCDYEQYSRAGGRVNHASCGYAIDGSRGDSEVRAARIEYEHIMPISKVTHGRPCGNRENCRETDSNYNRIEADPHNLTPVIGEVNALRSNFDFAELSHIDFDSNFGACEFKVDSQQRLVEPSDDIKGFVARTYFYMAWAYGAPIPLEKQAMLVRWNEQYPASKWEEERNERISAYHGLSNPFVTGDQVWSLRGERLTPATGIDALTSAATSNGARDTDLPAYIGNRNSGIFFPQGCHWYDRVGQSNRVPFNSAQEATQAGFRPARNC